MAKYKKTKKRSFVAGVISFIGSLVLVWGLYIILSAVFTAITGGGQIGGRIVLGLLVVVLCFVIQYAASFYDVFREHRKWVKRIKSAHIEEELAASDELARQAYRSNPTFMGLRFIEERNPKVAAEIRREIEENPKNPVQKLLNTLFNKQEKPEKTRISEAPAQEYADDFEIDFDFENDAVSDETIIR